MTIEWDEAIYQVLYTHTHTHTLTHLPTAMEMHFLFAHRRIATTLLTLSEAQSHQPPRLPVSPQFLLPLSRCLVCGVCGGVACFGFYFTFSLFIYLASPTLPVFGYFWLCVLEIG